MSDKTIKRLNSVLYCLCYNLLSALHLNQFYQFKLQLHDIALCAKSADK